MACAITPVISYANTIYTAPVLLKAPKWGFPKNERNRSHEAFIVYSFTITSSGSVESPRIEYSNNLPAFEEAVLDGISEASFEPATLNGKAIPVTTTKELIFSLSGKAREATSIKFRNGYRRVVNSIKKNDFRKAQESLNKMGEIPGRSLYEELRLQTLWADFHHAENDLEKGYRRLVILKKFMERDVNSDEDARLEQPGFFAPSMLMAYQYEVRNLMIADARSTLETLEKHFSDAEDTPRARVHFDGLKDQLRGNSFQTTGMILPNPLAAKAGVWRAKLSRKSFSLTDVEGEIDKLYLGCGDEGSFALNLDAYNTWNIPIDRDQCSLEVHGTIGTTFAIAQHVDESAAR